MPNTPHFQGTGKTVIVTGGGKGVGYGISEAFLQAGAQVYICGRREPEQLPQANGQKAIFIPVDVRDPEASQTLINTALEHTGRLDVLINNAGGSPPVVAADAPYRLSESIIRLNLIAPLILAQQAHNAMVKNGGGSIINIASVSGARPSPGTAAYGAAKAGLINLSRSLAQEWGPEQVRVNAIIAGLIRTSAAEDHYGGKAGIELIEHSLPMRRMATPEDIANACLFLAADSSAYVSGAALEVYGGGEPPSFLKMAEDALALAQG
ncbi:SDR family oxidoreductase [Pseudomaricurvus alkylphenolicus]|uniref:SDR family oxidoreductase n=1 Tax=Pseudomaricurvus alkylphenolicus TaxID=1306991 RepID=UPI00141EBBFB|nr:SDR family oxidoreductase [Pseudomaricurvus alkylphenolicus]NIB41006.1 SDR family oxidoreductase [Pseudomaricurvus alkylphenolicus]